MRAASARDLTASSCPSPAQMLDVPVPAVKGEHGSTGNHASDLTSASADLSGVPEAQAHNAPAVLDETRSQHGVSRHPSSFAAGTAHLPGQHPTSFQVMRCFWCQGMLSAESHCYKHLRYVLQVVLKKLAC